MLLGIGMLPVLKRDRVFMLEFPPEGALGEGVDKISVGHSYPAKEEPLFFIVSKSYKIFCGLASYLACNALFIIKNHREAISNNLASTDCKLILIRRCRFKHNEE